MAIETKKTAKETDTEVKVFPKPYPPLLSLQISNPVTYLKMWWHRVMWGEGVDIRFRVHPVTAIMMTAIIAGAAFGIGRFTLPPSTPLAPLIKYLPITVPSPTPFPFHHAAYTGLLHLDAQSKTYYLLTQTAEAITLTIPSTLNVSGSVGKRILAVGEYNTMTNILTVSSASDLELLPLKPSPFPTVKATPEPTPVAFM